MNIVLWVIQVILGIKLISVAYTHGLRQSKPTMQEAIARMGLFSKPLLYLVAMGTLVGALGLILPGATGILSKTTPVTAAILSIILLISLFFHLKSRDKPNIFVSIILSALAAFVAYGRWILAP